MKTEAQIETLLRKAPAPQPAPQLAKSLKSAITLSGHANRTDVELTVPLWRRWFPALAYAILILGCVVVLAVQTSHQNELIQQNEQLREQIALAQEAAEAHELALTKSQNTAREIAQLQHDAAEADRLAEELARLRTQIDALNAQAKDLEALLATAQEKERVIAPYDFFGATNSPLKEARDKATRIACVNNMKQIGVAYRIWANANDGWFPSNFNTLSNELSVAKTLCCPADQANQDLAAALFKAGGAGWAGWPRNGGSYEYRAAGLKFGEVSPNEVATKCRIHGFVGLIDGSVYQDPNYERKLRESLRRQP